jgi:alpha-1,3-rhamnosyl/mannosyltransferase
MDCYWRELERQRTRRTAGPVSITCALGQPPAESRESNRLIRVAQKYYLYPWLTHRATRGVDALHILDHSYAHLLTAAPRRGVYKIVTVHDLAPLRDPGTLGAGQQDRFRRTVDHLHQADLLLADSAHTAREAADLLGLPAAKLRVLPLGVDCERFEAPPAARAPGLPAELLGRTVVLSVGAVIPRKNLALLPAIFQAAGLDGVTLLRVGAPLPRELAAELRMTLGAGGLVELGYVPEALLVRAYQRASALLLPSRIEGFGFPVLEAMAAGCPVICTNVSSLPEVAGGAALYFAPDDPAEAGAHLRQVVADPDLRATLVAQGRQQAKLFSWDRHYDRLTSFYQAGAASEFTSPRS